MTFRDLTILSWISLQDVNAMDLYFGAGCESTKEAFGTLYDLEIAEPYVAVLRVAGKEFDFSIKGEKPRYVLLGADSTAVWYIWTFDNEDANL